MLLNCRSHGGLGGSVRIQKCLQLMQYNSYAMLESVCLVVALVTLQHTRATFATIINFAAGCSKLICDLKSEASVRVCTTAINAGH